MSLANLITSLAALDHSARMWGRRRRIPGSSNGRMRGSEPRDAGSNPAPGSIYTPRVTPAKLLASFQPGQDVVELEPQDYADVLTELVALRRYTDERDLDVLQDGQPPVIQGPYGPVTLVVRGAKPIAARIAHARCGYCGAPGQRIGSRCEYCQVAVSR